jgi:hypothetical protein
MGIDRMLATLESDITSAASIMGDAELITKLSGGKLGSATYLVEWLRSRIDRSSDLPEAVATLKSVVHTSENLLALDLDELKKIQLSRLKLQAELLLAAAL